MPRSSDPADADESGTGPEPEPAVGIGPWDETERGPRPSEPHFDQALLDMGDRRNVVDEFRYWTVEAIRAELDTRRHPFHVAIENWQHDMNIGSIVRTANACNAASVRIVGRRRWNRRGAMVTDAYQHIEHHETIAELVDWAATHSYPIVAVDNRPGAMPVEEAPIPEECVLLFGQEGPGLTEAAIDAAALHVEIRQFGSTRSINAAAAAAIVMHEWVRRHAPQS